MPETNYKKELNVKKEQEQEIHYELNDFNTMMGGTHVELV